MYYENELRHTIICFGFYSVGKHSFWASDLGQTTLHGHGSFIRFFLETHGSAEDGEPRHTVFLDGDFMKDKWPKTSWTPFESKYDAAMYLVAQLPAYVYGGCLQELVGWDMGIQLPLK